ncbi:MAG: alpha-1,4-glucan--maltose-1-phosphate maltosyltransferase [Nitrospira sp.]|nr:alpha-1,4-glucan--maltose-1-phosphate maltosyltransferase [Nitrospira sp.]MDR4462907.1 alpha-1,4-glucan--maltose-1-phosphate maltosyltransferase [Nitrospira sp.]MDR4467557.1 alpha-1,4-glucan--maltose-1-phosphate maltosyltransferase [Nitrospira sp.]
MGLKAKPKLESWSPIIIEAVHPEVDDGRYPIKREVGDRLVVSADIFKEGHDVLTAVLRYRTIKETTWHEAVMSHVDNDRWSGHFDLKENTRYLYTIGAFTNTFESWRQEVTKKSQAHERIESELLEGRAWVEGAMKRATGQDKARLNDILKRWRPSDTQEAQLALALNEELAQLVECHQERTAWTVYDRELKVVVDRVRARYGAWYEIFPRSQGTIPGKGSTFQECEQRLPAIKAMGFDVLYLTPIHPIGRTNRKGKNNSLTATPTDPGSPYAIGNEQGGHDAVEPSLGTIEDFDRFEQAVRAQGMELAMDFAINCSPDHPYVKEHPEWFVHRPDGTIKYAENPPKKYQDIYNVDFYCKDWLGLWNEMKRVILFWADHGVKIFRVDNPHTKPVAFWEWVIREVQDRHPDAIFLSEAFTRPKMMKVLAKAGFTQSYTYFTWRNFKQELTDYLIELSRSEMKEYFRPNFFTNTPDILPEILQQGGRPAFKFRLVLAATLSPSYGIYSGYELCENRALPGKEEYLDSEKYEITVWDWNRPGHIVDYVTLLNRIRQENPALHELENLEFYESSNDQVLFYGKSTVDKKNSVLVAVNLSPFQSQETHLRIPIEGLGIKPDETYQLHNVISDQRDLMIGDSYMLRLDPQVEPAAIFVVRRWTHREQEFDYFF